MCNYNEKELKVFSRHASVPFKLNWDSNGNYYQIESMYYQGNKYREFPQKGGKWIEDFLNYIYSKSEMFSDKEMCHCHVSWMPLNYKPFIEFGNLDKNNNWHKVFITNKHDKYGETNEIEVPTHIGIFLNKDAEFINKNFRIKPEFIYRFKSVKARGWKNYTFSVFKLPEEFILTGTK